MLGPLDDCSSLWSKINAATIPNFTPPLLLPDGYAVAPFNTDLAALKTAYSSFSTAEQSVRIEREQRNAVQDLAYAAMRDYRAAVLGSFAADHALVASLPTISPVPGSTPNAVTLSGQWDEPSQQAQLSWTESTEGSLQNYSLRMSPGPTYDTQNETVVDSVTSGQTTYETTSGLETSGDVASYKVYVVLDTGNESGSNAVTITRP